MPPSTGTSRDQILDAAELLMAEHGVDAVSLRDINQAAGQRNASSIQYHFGNRDGLLVAVVARHMHEIDAERNALLDELAATGATDARARTFDVVTALVQPLAARLATPSGRRYLRIVHQLLDRPLGGEAGAPEHPAIDPSVLNRSLHRVSTELTASIKDLPPRVRAVRAAQVTSFMLRALADQARRIDVDGAGATGPPDLPNDLFTANLVDVLVAVLHAPASERTARLARRRR